jgi:digalactosyldiacylglycerol synthase
VFLSKQGWQTTLYLPWLKPEQQHYCFENRRFYHPEEQQAYIQNWLPEELRPWLPEIQFYKAWYHKAWGVIYPGQSFARLVTQDHVLLEEPEHLFWTQPWSSFKHRRRQVTGIVHTNYKKYTEGYPEINRRLFYSYNRFLMQRICHRLICTSSVQQDICRLSQCRVENVNGVNPLFFRQPAAPPSQQGCYFMGKLVPEKGLAELFEGLQAVGMQTIDLFGQGDRVWVNALAACHHITPNFKGISPQPWHDLVDYKIFVNCSRSEILCTATADALAMQKWVIVPQHPSNEFFYPFQNCLVYADMAEFKRHFLYALAHDPAYDPNTRQLSWEAATQRLLKSVAITSGKQDADRKDIRSKNGRMPFFLKNNSKNNLRR